MNSLEDAYLNIAKEEEKLLNINQMDEIEVDLQPMINLDDSGKKNIFDQEELLDEEIKRFIEAETNSSFWRQMSATLKRRLQTYFGSPKYIMLSLNPFLLPLIYIIIIVVALDYVEGGAYKQPVLNYAFPLLVSLGIVTSCSMHAA